MKIIKPSFEIIEEKNPLLKVELCGRDCYKSEDRITDGSAVKFVGNILKRGHESVLEHAYFAVIMRSSYYDELVETFCKLQYLGYRKPLLRFTSDKCRHIVSGNARMWRDLIKACIKERYYLSVLSVFREDFPGKELFSDLKQLNQFPYSPFARFLDKSELSGSIERSWHHAETVRFIVDRGISHELVRHRTASPSQESTRYCNYSNGSFGGELTVIKPCFFDEHSSLYDTWQIAMKQSEDLYFELITGGATAQEARSVLPNSLKTEVVMTSVLADWAHFFNLRTSSAAHPQMREIAIPLQELFIDRNLVKLAPGRNLIVVA